MIEKNIILSLEINNKIDTLPVSELLLRKQNVSLIENNILVTKFRFYDSVTV